MSYIMHNGPIDEYQVRDCMTGDDESFRNLDAADKKFQQWKIERPDHPLMLIAVIDQI